MAHESVTRDDQVEGSTDRTFGLVFAALFTIIGLLPLVSGRQPRIPAIAVAALFLAVALGRPGLLAPLNRLWLRLGLLLHRVVSPVVLGIMFFLVMTPIGLLMRVMGKRPLRLGVEPDAPTYWIERSPPGPAGESLRDQF